MSAAVPLEDLFVAHNEVAVAGSSIVDSYNVAEVVSVNRFPGPYGALRSIVVYATHVHNPELPLAIKFTPLSANNKDAELRETRIHYTLTQMSCELARSARTRFEGVARKDYSAREVEKELRESIVRTRLTNVVALYDFVVEYTTPYARIRDRMSSGLASSSSAASRDSLARLEPFAALDAQFSVHVMRRYTSSLQRALREAPTALALMRLSRSAHVQVLSTLHQLLAIGFAHGDLHLLNIGVDVAPVVPRHFALAQDVWMHLLPEEPVVMLLDFGYSSMRFTDSRGEKYDERLTPAELVNRGMRMTAEQTFSPVFDLFRFVTSVVVEIARWIAAHGTAADLSVREVRPLLQELARGFEELTVRMPKGLGVPKEGRIMMDTLIEFVAVCNQPDWIADALVARARVVNTAFSSAQLRMWDLVWAAVLQATPNTVEATAALALPWDVLSQYRREGIDTVAPAPESVDLTLRPAYDRRKKYDARINSRDYAYDFRLWPLRESGLMPR